MVKMAHRGYNDWKGGHKEVRLMDLCKDILTLTECVIENIPMHKRSYEVQEIIEKWSQKDED